MNRYHIVTAIYALEKMKENIHEQVDKLSFGTSFLEISRREIALNREQKAAEALEAFRQLLTDPTTTPVDTPIETPAPRLSDDTANRIRKALGLYVDSLRDAASKVGALLSLLPEDKKLIQARFDAFRLIEQARQDLNEFNAVYPEEK